LLVFLSYCFFPSTFRRTNVADSDLVEAAKEAITAVFSDQSVSQSATRDRHEELRDEIDTLLETLPEED
jgi:hypothetical protein